MIEEKNSEESFDAGVYFNSLQRNQPSDKSLSDSEKRFLRISALDRLNALIRSEFYKSDYSEYIEKRGGNSDFYVGSSPIEDPALSYHLCLSEAGKDFAKNGN